MITQQRRKKKMIVRIFVFVVLIASGSLIYLLVIPFTHQKVGASSFSIFIQSDNDFDKYNFPGSGTEADPYIIENLTYTHFIYIFSVSKHFIIRNNIIYSNRWDSGISIGTISALNIMIINNVIYGSAYESDIEAGIRVYNVQNCSILNNTVYNKDIGIKVLSSSNCIIENNRLMRSGLNIDVKDCTELLILNNTLMIDKERSRYDIPGSISVDDSINISLESNTCKNSGIWFSSASSNTINLQENTVYGLEIGFFKNYANLLFNNSHDYGQLIFVNCSNCNLFNLSISNSVCGISFYNCSFTNCTQCNLSSNYYSGLYINNSKNFIISESTFNYSLNGVRIRYSDVIQVNHNIFEYNIFGVHVSNSNVSYSSNIFANNTQDIRVYNY